MEIQLTIENYRCFSSEHPASFTLGCGFTALVGVNNSGKSSLLKFFYEFRGLFETLSERNQFHQLLDGRKIGLQLRGTPFHDVFNVDNSEDITIKVNVLRTGPFTDYDTGSVPFFTATHAVVTVPRNASQFDLKLAINEAPGRLLSGGRIENTLYRHEDIAELIFFAHFLHAFKALASTFYIGPFRNILNLKSEGPMISIFI